MKEIRFCENCKKWFRKEVTEEVSVGSVYIPRYSSIEGHTKHTVITMCKKCLRLIMAFDDK